MANTLKDQLRDLLFADWHVHYDNMNDRTQDELLEDILDTIKDYLIK